MRGLEQRLGIRRRNPPRSPAASLQESGGAWLSDSGSLMHPEFYIGLGAPKSVQLQGCEESYGFPRPLP